MNNFHISLTQQSPTQGPINSDLHLSKEDLQCKMAPLAKEISLHNSLHLGRKVNQLKVGVLSCGLHSWSLVPSASVSSSTKLAISLGKMKVVSMKVGVLCSMQSHTNPKGMST